MTERKAQVRRETRETSVELALALDGERLGGLEQIETVQPASGASELVEDDLPARSLAVARLRVRNSPIISPSASVSIRKPSCPCGQSRISYLAFGNASASANCS